LVIGHWGIKLVMGVTGLINIGVPVADSDSTMTNDSKTNDSITP